MGNTEGDNGYLVYVPNTSKVVAVWDVIIKESEVGSIPDNTETPDLLDDGSQQMGIWRPDDGQQDDGNKEEQGTSTAKKWRSGMTQRACTLKKRHWDEMPEMLRKRHWMKNLLQQEGVSETLSLWKTVKWRTKTVGFIEEALEQADSAEPWRGSPARNVPQFFGEVRTHLAVTEGDYVEPKTVYEAKQGDDWDQWHRAMKEEVKAFQDNETSNQVRPPTDRDVIPVKWVYKLKLGPTGQIDKYKARYLAKCFNQVEGLDYFETFAPNCKPETFRILLQISVKQGYVMHQFDVKTAFLHSPIEEEVYLEQPQEFVNQGSDGIINSKPTELINLWFETGS